MPILFVRTGCQYCAKVLHAASELGVELEVRNTADPAVLAELMARGGKRQVPYLVDSERSVSLYESDDIIEHLHATFTPNP